MSFTNSFSGEMAISFAIVLSLSFDEAVKLVEKESGKHFDPDLVRLFLEHVEKFREVFERFSMERRDRGEE